MFHLVAFFEVENSEGYTLCVEKHLGVYEELPDVSRWGITRNDDLVSIEAFPVIVGKPTNFVVDTGDHLFSGKQMYNAMIFRDSMFPNTKVSDLSPPTTIELAQQLLGIKILK